MSVHSLDEARRRRDLRRAGVVALVLIGAAVAWWCWKNYKPMEIPA